MTLRKGLLRLLLLSLGLVAVGGALAVLMAERDVIWRVVGTGLATAVGAGLLISGGGLLIGGEMQRAVLRHFWHCMDFWFFNPYQLPPGHPARGAACRDSRCNPPALKRSAAVAAANLGKTAPLDTSAIVR
jgi:hypothetical protein